MGMVVQHNMNALNAYNKLNTNVAGLKKSSEKLSSGYRINRAGDDAAGLAISEKMRSQIRGLTQAKRNSQDGISMIQTFEGATQESHSILQRMKELASESANGTYQDEVDRDAIQLEFNQLNDELDQIADTDFNGVVMLNGGQMADGTKAVGNKFDYSNNVRSAKQLTSVDLSAFDGSKFASAPDTTNATTTNADAAWAAWSAGKGAYDRHDDKKADGPESFNVTFQYDGNGKWTATKSSDAGIDVSKVNDSLVNSPDDGSTAATTTGKNNGGFTLYSGTTFDQKNEVANVVVDTSNLKAGDTITLTFNNPLTKNYAPGNISMTVSDNSAQPATDKIAPDNAAVAATVVLGDGQTANKIFETSGGQGSLAMTKTAADSFNALKDATITTSYKDGKVSGMSFKLKDGSTLSLDTTAAATGSITTKDGIQLSFESTQDAGVTTIKDADGNTLFTITPNGAGTDDYNANSGTVSSVLSFDTVSYSETKATVEVAQPADNAVSKANSNGKATASLTYSDHMVLQTGSRTKDSVDFTFKYNTNGMGDLKSNLNLSSRADGLNTKNLSLATQEDANAAIDKIDNAINKVSMVRATFGATQNRLEHKIENLTTNTENLTEAESTIRDTDMASEMLNYTKYNVLQQAAQSMLAQANQQPQSILQLLG